MHNKNKNSLSFLTFRSETARGYGRVIRDEHGRIKCIIEEKHLGEGERGKYKEFNGGVYVIARDSLSALRDIEINKESGEYYLTDIVSILSSAGKKIEAYECPEEEIHGVNNRQELFRVSDIMRKRIIERMMSQGITFLDPGTSIIHPSVKIGRDTVIYPNTYIEGDTVIGKNCVIYPGVRIINSKIGNGVIIKDNSLIEDSVIKDSASIGPFAHLRPGSIIGRKAKIGNFVEVKKSRIGDGTKASHLTYLGDAEIGKNVNIGAGTITCNYDGKHKHRTIIKSGVFVGSDAQLIAPVKIGKGAFIAAGATITKDVPSGALAISRVKQQNILGWVKRKRG
jgi:bifunctional UDP-N-acetylglucosamine pyrophosphorylase/glucosamine-1-phosphate N-acetyltransferase